MKKLLFILSAFLFCYSAFSQSSVAAEKTPAYILNPSIPDFTVYKAPDSTAFTQKDLKKNEATLLMLFSPECGHCQNETKDLIKNIEHFKNTQILMVTWLPYSELVSFYKMFKLADYPQITTAWDRKDFFVPYYEVQMYPKLIVYDKKGKYVTSFSGPINLDDVWKAME